MVLLDLSSSAQTCGCFAFLRVSEPPRCNLDFMLNIPSCRIQFMPLRPLALVPGRSAMLAEGLRQCGIGAARNLQGLGVLLITPQCRQHALGRKRSLTQANSYCVVDRIGDRRNRRCQ